MWYVFQEMAKEALQEIYEKEHDPDHCRAEPVFYIQALLYDIDFTENDE